MRELAGSLALWHNDEGDPAQNGKRRGEETEGERFAEEKDSAGGGQDGDTELDGGGAGGFERRQGGIPEDVAEAGRDRA